MRRKIVLLMILASALILTSCKKSNVTKTSDGNANEVAVSQTENVEENTAEDKSETESEGDIESSEDTKRDSKECYEAFLNGTEPLYFDMANIDGNYPGDAYEPLFEKDTPYTIDDILEAVINMNGEYDENCSIGEVTYAYIDCGQDKEPELVISYEEVNGYTGDVDSQRDLFIKKIDDKLELIHSEDFGYRSYVTVKDNGCIVFGGSGGAAYNLNAYKYIDKDGNYVFVYGVNTSYSPYDLFYEKEDFDESQYEDIMGRSMYEEYYFRDYGDGEDYNSYKKDEVFVYYAVDGNYEPIMDDRSIYEPDSEYAKFFGMADVNFVTPDESKKLVSDRLEKLGITQEMLDKDEVRWTILRKRPEFVPKYEESAPDYVIDNPSWEYVLQSDAKPTNKKLKLTKISQEANDITDDYVWFNEIGMIMPDRNYFSDQSFAYSLSGVDAYYPFWAEIIDLGSNHTIANLDFKNHRYADNLVESDRAFVDESIKYMVSDGFTLYVSVAHNTYASSASHNAYVMALDMQNDYNVLWKSQPLVANAENFIVLDDFIVCGYGFTAEDDYLYILDKYTGKVLDKILLKTGPDYIYEVNDKIYVRTYDTNYVFDYEVVKE